MSRNSVAGPPPRKVSVVPVVVYAPTAGDLQLCDEWAAALHWNVVGHVADPAAVAERMRQAKSTVVLAGFGTLVDDHAAYQLRKAIEGHGGQLHAAVDR